MRRFFIGILTTLFVISAYSQESFEELSNENNLSTREDYGFNKSDSTRNRSKEEKPIGLKVWTIDKRFGDRSEAYPDTLPHMYMNSIFTNGLRGEYNTLGNVGSPRINRIFIDCPENQEFIFTQPYSFFITPIDELHFTNTLSPITNIDFNQCGSSTTGEDHLKALFAVNAGKKLGFGMKFDYIYGHGYYQNAQTAHFNYSLFGSYIGDRYQSHLLISLNHQKLAENGGITNDEYILHPESFDDNFREEEIPVNLSNNWNRNDNQHIFYSQRYNVGFNRKVKMSEEEIKAKKFAIESKQNAKKKGVSTSAENEKPVEPVDTSWMKTEYVPVTSFIHTLNFSNYRRIYQAYDAPDSIFANTYFHKNRCMGDSVYDLMRHYSLKNTFAVAMLEGFNKWVPMGLKLFASHELCRFVMPNIVGTSAFNENYVYIGGQLLKSQGRALHYNALLETCVLGDKIGEVKLDIMGDVNFPMFGDTVTLQAKGFYHLVNPGFYYMNFQSKHLWWKNDFEKENRVRIEGVLNIKKTHTSVRIALDDIKNLTYFAQSYDITDDFGRMNNNVVVKQESDMIGVFTAQLSQDLTLGPLNWESVVTYQKSSNNAIPVPDLNIYTNLYLKFKYAKVLHIELGGDLRYFTKYYAPDYSPYIGSFCVQDGNQRVKVGGYPIIDVYANFFLKHARFFAMMSHVNATGGNYFHVPHYPQNNMLFRVGVSWNFFN